jgi:hypothetical protein
LPEDFYFSLYLVRREQAHGYSVLYELPLQFQSGQAEQLCRFAQADLLVKIGADHHPPPDVWLVLP